MEIVLRSVNDDWEELLINGEQELEGHSLPLSEVIRLVKPPEATFTQVHVNRCIYCEAALPDDSRTFKCEPKCPCD